MYKWLIKTYGKDILDNNNNISYVRLKKLAGNNISYIAKIKFLTN